MHEFDHSLRCSFNHRVYKETHPASSFSWKFMFDEFRPLRGTPLELTLWCPTQTIPRQKFLTLVVVKGSLALTGGDEMSARAGRKGGWAWKRRLTSFQAVQRTSILSRNKCRGSGP